MSSDVDDLVGTNRKSSVTDFFPDFYENNLSWNGSLGVLEDSTASLSLIR